MIIGAGIVAVPSIEARTTAGSAVSKPQIRIQIGRNRRYRRYGMRSYVTTRVVRDGWRTYRETLRTTYYPDGTMRTEVISRDRIR
jgi:hypothetical protein